jgi:hypothetical protein
MNSRRRLLKGALLMTLIGLRAASGSRALGAAAPRTPLEEQDAAAKVLGYRQDARSVDPQAFPTWRRGQSCSTCALVEFGTARLRGCTLFPGNLVASAGWCSGWQQRGAKK